MEIVGKSGINLTLAVLGTGQMGRGIVQLALQRGMKVIFVSRTQQRLAAVQNEIETFFLKSMSKQEAGTLLQDNLLLSTNMASVAEADVVIESVTEDRTAKKNLFSVLNKVCSSKTIIVTNTSSLSVTELAEGIDNPSRVAGLHFFNPVHKMPMYSQDNLTLPVTESIYCRGINLPSWPGLSDQQLSQIVSSIRKFYAGN